MLQNLLADRFQLKLHRESKDAPIYALVVAKNGPKLKESAPGAQGSIGMSQGNLSARGVPVAALADQLSGPVFQLGRPVIDRTGISGIYDFTLDWASDDSAPSVFTALQEQLGLKLEAQKGSVEVLVVDSMERKPSAN
jgi:uncharacterized protein (TIGR03435 family)